MVTRGEGRGAMHDAIKPACQLIIISMHKVLAYLYTLVEGQTT